jgi:hypothetical protein
MTEHQKRGLERQRRLEFYKAKLVEYGPIDADALTIVLPQWKAECDARIVEWESTITVEVQP